MYAHYIYTYSYIYGVYATFCPKIYVCVYIARATCTCMYVCICVHMHSVEDYTPCASYFEVVDGDPGV